MTYCGLPISCLLGLQDTAGNVAWANDNKTLLYVTKDKLDRPFKVACYFAAVWHTGRILCGCVQSITHSGFMFLALLTLCVLPCFAAFKEHVYCANTKHARRKLLPRLLSFQVLCCRSSDQSSMSHLVLLATSPDQGNKGSESTCIDKCIHGL